MAESRSGFGLTLVEITRKLWQHGGARSPLTEQHRGTEDRKMSDGADDLGFPVKQGRPAPVMPRRVQAEPFRHITASAPAPGSPQPPTEQPVGSHGHEVDRRTLIIGEGISLSGEVTSCDRLIVEGTIEAKLEKCQHVIIAETGVFNGNASTENADVRGRFQGELVVRKRLLIRAGGHASGTITYGEVEIESGGKISGTIQEIGAADVVPNLRPARA